MFNVLNVCYDISEASTSKYFNMLLQIRQTGIFRIIKEILNEYVLMFCVQAGFVECTALK